MLLLRESVSKIVLESRLTFIFMHLADAFIRSDIFLNQYVCSLGIEPIIFFALQTQCSTTESQEHDLWVESKQPFCGHKAKILTHVY